MNTEQNIEVITRLVLEAMESSKADKPLMKVPVGISARHIHLTQEDVERLPYLTKLQKIDASGCTEYGRLLKLQQEHPEWDVNFRVMVGTQECTVDQTAIEADNATVGQLRGAMEIMPKLQTVIYI